MEITPEEQNKVKIMKRTFLGGVSSIIDYMLIIIIYKSNKVSILLQVRLYLLSLVPKTYF